MKGEEKGVSADIHTLNVLLSLLPRFGICDANLGDIYSQPYVIKQEKHFLYKMYATLLEGEWALSLDIPEFRSWFCHLIVM